MNKETFEKKRGVRAVKRRISPDGKFFYVSLVASKRIPVPTGHSLAPVQNISI